MKVFKSQMWLASHTQGIPLLILLYYIHPHLLYSTMQWTVNSPQSLNATQCIWMRTRPTIWSLLHAHPQSGQRTDNTQFMMALAGEEATITSWMAESMKFPLYTIQLPMKINKKNQIQTHLQVEHVESDARESLECTLVMYI